MTTKNKPIFIISGATAVGKSTIIAELLKDRKLKLKKVITSTTRKIRASEKPDIDRHFLTLEEFQRKVQNNEFLEYSRVFENLNGIQRVDLESVLKSEYFPILDIDIQGVQKLKKALRNYNLVTIFIKYDSKESIKKRLESSDERSNLDTRLKLVEKEENMGKYYDFSLKNIQGKLKQTVDRLKRIVRSSCTSYQEILK